MNYSHLEKISTNIKKLIDIIPNNEKNIIIYDIDDTLIDTEGFAITPIINSYKYALQKGIKTVIITARVGTNENINHTIEQLKEYGIDNYVYIYFLPVNKYDNYQYKFLARKNLYERGYNIIASIGDMPWDIGIYGGIGFKINHIKYSL
jgi:hypothetical protein